MAVTLTRQSGHHCGIKLDYGTAQSNDNGKRHGMAKTSEYFLNGDITEENVFYIGKWLLERNQAKEDSGLTIYIYSMGGKVLQGFALADLIRLSKIPVTTIGVGFICSMGLHVFLAGTNRALTRDCFVVAHQLTTDTATLVYEDFVVHATWTKDMKIKMEKYVARRTGLSIADVRKKVLRSVDSTFNAKQALKLGICHRVI